MRDRRIDARSSATTAAATTRAIAEAIVIVTDYVISQRVRRLPPGPVVVGRGWMDGWMAAEPNQTIKPYCLHIHTNTSQCVPVCPSVSRTRVPMWDKPYCLHIQAHAHTSVPVCPSQCVPVCPSVSHCGINHTVYTYIHPPNSVSVPNDDDVDDVRDIRPPVERRRRRRRS